MRLAEHLGATPADTLARFLQAATSTVKPLVPVRAMLGEAVVHAEDIRRPLGIARDYPESTLTLLADYYQGSNVPVQTKARVRGLRLAAADGPFTTGSGPLVSGPTLALIMTMAGRMSCLDDLEGDGVPLLRERCVLAGAAG